MALFAEPLEDDRETPVEKQYAQRPCPDIKWFQCLPGFNQDDALQDNGRSRFGKALKSVQGLKINRFKSGLRSGFRQAQTRIINRITQWVSVWIKSTAWKSRKDLNNFFGRGPGRGQLKFQIFSTELEKNLMIYIFSKIAFSQKNDGQSLSLFPSLTLGVKLGVRFL